MTTLHTLSPDRAAANTKPVAFIHWFRGSLKVAMGCVLMLAAALFSAPARAADGCVILLCLAAPSWRSIPQCVPPIRQLLRDLARGRAFPVCGMGGAGNESEHRFSHAPGYCPPHYVRERTGPNGPIYSCEYTGAVSVTVNGALFTRTWWRMDGDAVTEFTDAARAQLGSWDPRFELEHSAWLANPPSPPPTETP